MRIFLIGFMGSGKTTLGSKLSKLMGYRFVDTDNYIEEKYNTTISDLFGNKGELEFREIERKAINELIKEEKIIISTGGGTPCFFNNMEKLNNNGITVYLKVDIKTIIQRVAISKKDRPLIAQKSNIELEDYIKDLLNKREKYYSKSNLTVEGISLRAEDLLLAIEGYKMYNN